MNGISLINYINDMPTEIISHIFSFLDVKSLIACGETQKSWHQEIKDYKWVEKRFFYSHAFTQNDWKQCIGNPSPEQPSQLPNFIEAIAQLKKIYGQQKLSRLFFAWIPQKINNLPLNFSLFHTLKVAKHIDYFFHANPLAGTEISEESIDRGGWWAINMQSLEKSCHQTYSEQIKLVEEEHIPKEFELILLIHLYFWKNAVHPLKISPPGEIVRCRKQSQKFFLTPAIGTSSEKGVFICHLAGGRKWLHVKILPAIPFS